MATMARSPSADAAVATVLPSAPQQEAAQGA
jgi:hypothetical protein